MLTKYEPVASHSDLAYEGFCAKSETLCDPKLSNDRKNMFCCRICLSESGLAVHHKVGFWWEAGLAVHRKGISQAFPGSV